MSEKYTKGEDIDLIELLQTVWKERKTILKVVLIFFLLGLFIAVFSPKEFTASSVVVPQTNEGNKLGSNLGGLAAIAGINLGSSSSNGIPATLYPKIVNSVPFKKELLQTPLNFSDISNKITYRGYYENHEKFNLLNALKKYTIGLPRVIVKAIKGEAKENNTLVGDSICRVSPEEKSLFKKIDGQLNVEVNAKEGFVTISFSMPEALPSAQMAKKVQQLLQNAVTNFKIKKSEEQLSFIQKRFREKEKEFREKQGALASYRDRNVGLVTSRSQSYLQRLQSEYNLIFGVYSELAKQLETQKIQVKENTPIFTVIEPVSIPVEKSKPKRAMILAIWLFLGVVLGISVVFVKKRLKSIKKVR